MSEMEYDLGYREVVPDQNFVDKWQEIILTTGIVNEIWWAGDQRSE